MEVTDTIRASEWWESKLSPIFATIYGTIFLIDTSLFSAWPILLLAFAALVPGAAYVSVINDVTDLEEDRVGGKRNRHADKSKIYSGLLILGCLTPGIIFLIIWRKDLFIFIPYLSAWIIYTLYSVPPFRLKKRGGWGLLADAAGAHLFPTLFVVALAYHYSNSKMNVYWVVAVGVWALSFGLRGILWHQLGDRLNDQKAGLSTFACRHDPKFVEKLGTLVVFPIEIAAFFMMLIVSKNYLAWPLLTFYIVLEWLRYTFWQVNIVIVAPRPRFQIAMQEFYELFYPLAFLIAASLRYRMAIVIMILHFLLFRGRMFQVLDFIRLGIKDRRWVKQQWISKRAQ